MTLLPDVETAMSWLNSFAFVGMTDDYSRSVCLSHAMFPTPRRAVSRRRVPEHKPNGLQQLDPTDKAKGSAANQFYPDEYDSRVWARAKEIYTLALAKYRITRARCKAICPSASDAFDQVAF